MTDLFHRRPTHLRKIELPKSQEYQACKNFYVVQATSAKFGLHAAYT
jgi:hypothetical protein